MKISDILVSFLQKNKTLALPGLGTFTLRETAYVLPDDDKQPALPPGSVEFELDRATPEDPALIAEISRITGKIKPLASSDLEALVIQGKQLINISKPFQIEGLGSLQKNHRGEVEFIPYVGEEHRAANEKRSEEPGEPIRFGENYLKPETQVKSTGSRTATLAALFVAGFALIAWVGYYFYQQSAQEDAPQTLATSQLIATIDTTAVSQQVVSTDSTVTTPPPVQDSAAAPAPAPVNTITTAANVEGFNLIVEYAKRTRALKRYADLREWGHKAQMTTSDSNTFKIFIPVKAPLSDSAKHRDSLSRFFGRQVWVETTKDE